MYNLTFNDTILLSSNGSFIPKISKNSSCVLEMLKINYFTMWQLIRVDFIVLISIHLFTAEFFVTLG